MEKVRDVKLENLFCQSCGGEIKWNISKQCFECSACRTAEKAIAVNSEVIEHDFAGYSERDSLEMVYPDKSVIVCKTCGAQVAFDKSQTAAICPMCGSSQIAQEKQLEGVAPDGIIPFKVDKPQAQENFRGWVKGLWFAPNKLKKSYQEGRLESVYLPFWTFDAGVTAYYVGEGGMEYEVEGSDGKKETKVRWTPVSGTFEGSFDDVLVCASESNANSVIKEILPYSTQEGSLPFSTAYLAGFIAERYAIKADVAVNTAKEEIEDSMSPRANVQISNKGYDRSNVQSIRYEYDEIKYKHLLLPAWISAFAYGGKQYVYMINGETGRVGGDRPFSVPKIITAVIIVLAMLVGLFALFMGGDDETSASRADFDKAVYLQDESRADKENIRHDDREFILTYRGGA